MNGVLCLCEVCVCVRVSVVCGLCVWVSVCLVCVCVVVCVVEAFDIKSYEVHLV